VSHNNNDNYYMGLALDQAHIASEQDEVPVGAVIVKDNAVIACAHNLRESRHNATAHAEILAINKACDSLDAWRLAETTLYVTLEPCAMCAGAIVNARIPRLVYGAQDPKAGAVDTLYTICTDARLNHTVDVTAGVLASECGSILTAFFRAKRSSSHGNS
jgi:tRNA(adenine34) deaminase